MTGMPVVAQGRHRPASVLLAVIGSVILLGLIAGAIWTAVTPAMTGRVLDHDSAIIPAEQFPEEFAGVGAFAVVMFVYGLISAVVGWLVARTWRGPDGFVFVLASSVLGGALAMWVGTALAHWRFGDPHGVAVGATFRVVPHLWLDSAAPGFWAPWILLICAPIAVVLAYLVCTLLSKHADLGVGDLVVDTEKADVAEGALTSADAASRTRR